MKRTHRPARFILSTFVTFVLCAALIAPARAQSDAIGGEVAVLKGKVAILEARFQNDHDASLLMRAQLDQARKDIVTLKQDMADEKVSTQALQTALEEFLKEHPDSGKPPAPSPAPAPAPAPAPRPSINPAGPANNQPLSVLAPFIVKDKSGRILFMVDAGTTGSTARAIVGNPAAGRVEVATGMSGAGVVRAYAASGNAVAALYGDTNGGQVVLTGPAGGHTAASLSVNPAGGAVRVFPVGGGTARAELIADESVGALNVFASDGSNVASVASLNSKSGRLELNTGTGNIAVEAGTTKSGAGYVAAGPYDQGVAQSMLSVGKPASSLLGSVKSK